jgi:hypothetical protein
MKSEFDEIQDDEWLLRRVLNVHFRTGKDPIMSDSAFSPRLRKAISPDTEGISLYRRSCLSSPMEIVKPENQHKHGIVGVKVSELKALGLTVKINPESRDNADRIDGHVVIPELSCDEYEQKKSTIKVKIHRLAEITSAEDHIFWDPNKHVDSDPSNFE